LVEKLKKVRLSELIEKAEPERAFPIEEPDMKRRLEFTNGIRIKPLEELSPLEHLASIHDRLTWALYDMRSVLKCIEKYGDTPAARTCIVEAIRERQSLQLKESML